MAGISILGKPFCNSGFSAGGIELLPAEDDELFPHPAVSNATVSSVTVSLMIIYILFIAFFYLFCG